MPANRLASSRQKSFFDQHNKVRPNWPNSRRRDNDIHQSEYTAKPPTAITPIAPSLESMSKLRAFQFQPQNETHLDDVEDQGLAGAVNQNFQNNQVLEKTNTPQATPNSLSASQRSMEKDFRDCPQTPVGRLPLAELIAGGNDINHRVVDLVPVERVLWNHSQQSDDPDGSQGGRITKRGKKRAHSSSPLTSQNETRKIFVKEVSKLEKVPPSLKTPQADPVNDLWSRYSLATDKPSPTRRVGPIFSSLHSSSPQTPTTHLQFRESGKLRRSYSCNVEWPTSATKRRKIQYSSSNQEAGVGYATYEQGYEPSRNSKIARVSLLVEQIQNRLAKSGTQDDENGADPPSLLPLLEETSFSTGAAASPPRVAEMDTPGPADVPDHGTAHLRCSLPSNMGISNVTEYEHVESTPKFGRDDNYDEDDEDGVDILESELMRTTDAVEKYGLAVASSSAAPSFPQSPTAHCEPTAKATSKAASQPHEAAESFPKLAALRSVEPDSFDRYGSSTYQCSPKDSVLGLDEFDDDDSAAFAADLEDIIAKYDTKTEPYVQPPANRIPSNAGLSTKPESTTFGTNFSSKVRKAPRVETGIKSGAVSEEEFDGDYDFENIIAQCEEASQEPHSASRTQSSNGCKPSTIQRYLILNVVEGKYDTMHGRSQSEKVLSVENEKTKLRNVVILRGTWLRSQCSRGSCINIIGEFDQHGQCVVDDTRNLLITDPDHLISATVVADSFSCTRRAVLQDRVKATTQPSEATIYGSMLHEIFQDAMRANRWDTEWLTATVENVATRYIESLFEMDVTFASAVDHLSGKVIELQAWAQVFVTARPKANAVVKDRNGATALMSISKLLDVEEKLWSPAYGLKGMVDATVQVTMKDGENDRVLTVPLEIKTGKFPNAAHRAQTALYTLLLSDRYDVEVIYGILYYTETSDISRIPAVRHELIHMVMQRNELANYVRQRYALPPMLKSPHLCGKCYAQTPCFLYHKLVENGTGKTSGMEEKFDDLVKHLKPIHQEFFRKWDELITKEEKDVVKLRRELWTMPSTEREKLGRCFAHVVIDLKAVNEQQDAPKINRYSYAFLKQKTTPGFSFTDSQICVGEPIVISDEHGHFAFASGYVTSVRKHRIHVTVDRRLHNARARTKDFDGERNQSFTGIMEVIEDDGGQQTHMPSQSGDPVLYRIDKDEFSNGMATVRNNLIRLMENDVFGTQALRRLIVEGVAPTFKPTSTPYSLTNSASQDSLNVDQRFAIEKVMSAKDYALVLGMPGTGKTTTIAHIIRALTAQGKSVLLTSYTHTAVDNILLKIRKDNIGVFRLGAVAKVHPEIQEFADLGGVPMKTVEEIKKSYSRQVVATTCLGVNHPIFNQRIFDYCIVDEASQITLPVCLGPIRMARTFILVGDHFQLPPLVQNKEALEGGLDISLFKTLSEQHPASVINLEHQYRMCDDIMALSNTLIYDGRLKCGTPAVAHRTLRIPNINALSQHHHTLQTLPATGSKSICVKAVRGSCWIRDLLDPSVKACLVNTDPLLPISRESESGSRIINACEATLCTNLVDSLITTGVPASDIGVITLYRSQLALLKQNLRHQHPAVEMHTADKFQGRDKEVVVLSLVRSNERQNVGYLLKDWRRVNVAFTRARTKLLVVGSAQTIRGNELLQKFVTLMEGKGWMYDLPKGALEGHRWDQSSSLGLVGRGEGVGETSKVDQQERKGFGSTRNKEKENIAAKARRVPLKVGRLDTQALLGKRPVLRDIVNDAS